MDQDLTPLEADILEYLLIDGANGPAGISDGLDRPRSSISRSCSNLKDRELIYDKGGQTFGLTAEGLSFIRIYIRESDSLICNILYVLSER